jgi:hypothetical protein
LNKVPPQYLLIGALKDREGSSHTTDKDVFNSVVRRLRDASSYLTESEWGMALDRAILDVGECNLYIGVQVTDLARALKMRAKEVRRENYME